ncbi:MAG: gliding motility-associated protein GldE [Candidatus Competibacteraceae bacterium]|nr:gliding motility-associated protein GldE [Candidatus Competibacteraceae bacterium]
MDDPLGYTSIAGSMEPMMQSSHLWYWITIVLLLICSGLISASEVAFFSLSEKDIDEIENESLRKRIRKITSYPKKLLATILILNNAVNIAIIILSSISTQLLFAQANIPDWAIFLIQIVAVTFIILLFGEVLPKIYSTYHPLKLVKLMLAPLAFFNVALSWLSAPLLLSGRFFDKRIKKNQETISAIDLNTVIEMTNDVTVTEEEKKIWKGVVEFGTISVKETMKPRTDVMALEYHTPFSELLQFILQFGYSRIPVYKEHFDQIEGVLYIKDVIPHIRKPSDFAWQTLIRPTFFVPENKMIDDLLKEFQEKKMHLAIVVDEFGGTSGIVTLEDIIEEIVGEINDEFDDEEVVYSRIDENTYLFDGKTTLINLCRILQINYEQIEPWVGDADTIAGMILQINQKLPLRGQTIESGGLRFVVESVDKRRIKSIRVIKTMNSELL